MTKEEKITARQLAQQEIRQRSKELLTRDKSGKGYICPICGSGSGENGTGITENPKSQNHFTCWAGKCFENADIFDIYMKKYGVNFDTAFNHLCDALKIDVENSNFLPFTGNRTPDRREIDTEPAENYTDFYNMAEKNLTKTNYHRGISIETLKKYHVGYIEKWQSPKALKAGKNPPCSPRLIVPVWTGGYLARDTRENLTVQEKSYAKMHVGKVRLFNEKALAQTQKPVFIVEGEIDALSIIDAGGQAVALCSVANWEKVVEAVKTRRPAVGLIIALDSDNAGVNTAEKIMNGLQEINYFTYRQYSIPEPYKDANEFLNSDRVKFTEWVKAGESLDFEKVKEAVTEEDIDYIEASEHETGGSYLNNLLLEIDENREGQAISTGFENLDEMLNGGLYPGLYFIGANSSAGKTTFMLQVADNIARSGRGVFMFSLEMSGKELVAKSLSRLSFIESGELYKSSKCAKTTRGILRGVYTDAENEVLYRCIREYEKWDNNIWIIEGVGDVGVTSIKDRAERYLKSKKSNGIPPVIFIDYLQILSPYSAKMTDKQNVDKNVIELKRLSRDYKVPVIATSSFNRESYTAPVSMSSFKESGAIEYSSDVLIGLQYDGWDYQEGEKEAQRLSRLRDLSKQLEQAGGEGRSQKMQMKILKHRNGKRGSAFFNFYPKFNYFSEIYR
ncbi:MAG: toprim domain-containing protein [Synergistaceae bacterium]|nr:toprim domain-containing protein [Synergistaceae bacterium]